MHRLLNGRYRVIKPIARGGMAEVWEGYDERLSRPVAIKILKAHLASDTSFLERFRREAITAARLAHPNVVAAFDTGIDHQTQPPGPDVAYIVMELVRGENLRQLLRRQGPLALPLAVAIATQITDALVHAHRAGLVHRDIKPANVLIADDGWDSPQVKVTDFGIAKVAEGVGLDLTRTGMVLGTPKYLSPEQIQGEEPDPRADLYALGVVLFEMLAGRPPFAESTEMATALAHLNNPPPDLTQLRPELPASLVRVVRALLAKNVADRVPSAVVLRRLLNEVSRDVGSPTIPNPAPDTAGTSLFDPDPTPGRPGPLAAPPRPPANLWTNGSAVPTRRSPTGPAPAGPPGGTASRTAVAPANSTGERRIGRIGPTSPAGSPVADNAIPDPPARPRRTGRGLSVVVGMLIVVAVVVVALLLANPRQTPTASGNGHTSTGGSTAANVKALSIRNVTELIARGYSPDNLTGLPYAYDHNPDTAWTSDQYQTAAWGGMYPGLGLAIHLNRGAVCHSLTVTSNTRDWSAQVYVADHDSSWVTGWGTAVSSQTAIDGSTTFSLGDRRGSWVLLWLTSTGVTNGYYQMSVTQLSVTGSS